MWLFGVGFANVCVAAGLSMTNGHPSGFAVSTLATLEDAAAAAGHAHPAGQEMPPAVSACHDEAPGKSNCQDFCEKSAITIAALKLALDHGGADALPPPSVAIVCAVADCEPRLRSVPRCDGGLAPPVTIAYLRLAL